MTDRTAPARATPTRAGSRPAAKPTPKPTPKPRHDAFDGKRRRAFLDALGKCGCLRDAARRAGVSHQTVYNHQASDRQFAHQCDLALQMASTDIELHAWERGVVGIEEPIVRGGEVIGTRLKRSDSILRLLLQGAKRKKYGPNPGFGRKRLHKLERDRIERDLRAEHREREAKNVATAAETDAALQKLLDGLAKRRRAADLKAGWTYDGKHPIPPGWVRADPAETTVPGDPRYGFGEGPTDDVREGAEEKGDSV